METKVNALLQSPLVVINLALKKFAESLEEYKIEVVQLVWAPVSNLTDKYKLFHFSRFMVHFPDRSWML